MFKVNNKKTIHKLAKSSFKANRLRNIFAVIAIILTTVLFTGLFTVASSLLSSMEESTMRQVGGSAHGTFKYLNQEQYDRLKAHKSIVNSSYSVVLGIAENDKLAKRPTEIRYTSDETNAKGTFSMPTTGRLPQNEYEMATDTIVLKRLGIPAELGQKITLEYSVSGEKRSDTFTLVGFWSGDKLMQASQIWLDRTYVEKQLEGYLPSYEHDFIGKLNADVNFSNSFNIESKMLKVITDSGYHSDEIAYGVNWAYTGNSDSADMGTILGSALAVLMIAFCGYLIISNVFYISVAKDTRFYGMLKTIGTTGKQIRFLIRRQALLLCLLGIPLGLIAGFFVGALLTPVVLSILNTNVIKISMNPMAFIVSALFAILTVAISIAKPSKIAAKVSPIEALRSTDSTNSTNNANRKNRKNGAKLPKKHAKKSGRISPFRMASANVFRNRKKAAVVTISLALSLIILNSAYSVANSFDMDKYLSGMIGSDFAIGDASYFNVHMNYSDQDTLSPDFLEELSTKSGIEKLSNIYFSDSLANTDPRLATLPSKLEQELGLTGEWLEYAKMAIQNPMQPLHIYGLDDDTLGLLTVWSGAIDLEKLKTGKYVIVGPYDADGIVNCYDVGDKIELPTINGTKEYEVLAVASLPYNISAQHSHPITLEFFLPSNLFLQEIADKAPMLTTLQVEDNLESEMEAYLSDYCQNIEQNMQYESKATFMAEYENTQRTYKSVGIVLSMLVAFIGIMNFINTVITSIMSRKRELAMLQSIGMTNRQTETMLITEGLIYTALTAVFALTVGSLLGYYAIGALASGGLYLSSQFTVLPSLLCLPVLAVISAIVPFLCQRTISRHSVVERLREIE